MVYQEKNSVAICGGSIPILTRLFVDIRLTNQVVTSDNMAQIEHVGLIIVFGINCSRNVGRKQ